MVRKITYTYAHESEKRQNYFAAHTVTGEKETHTVTNSAVSPRIDLTTRSKNVEANVKMFQCKNTVKLHGIKH